MQEPQVVHGMRRTCQGTRSKGPLRLMFLCALATATPGQVETVVLKRGSPLVGRVLEREGDEVLVNTLRTGLTRAVRGQERVPKDKVKAIVLDTDPHREFWRRAALAGTAADWVGLARDYAPKKGLSDLASHAWTEALVLDPRNETAQKGLGDAAWKRLQAEDPRFNAPLKEALERYLASNDFAERVTLFAALTKLGERRPHHYLERAWRSAREKKGRSTKQPLTFASETTFGRFCLFVPSALDPLDPTPLLIGLHGGGPGGKDRDLVVGSGEAAMNFYEREAEARGYVVACPTANRAPWSRAENDAFVLALVEEMCVRFNVDQNRIYLAGHSMGGFGTWHFGPKYAHLWAAVAPASGGGRPDLKRLSDTLTGVYCHHGADDRVVTVETDRALATEMQRKDMDFVYCELPDSGHGWPEDVRAEMWSFFAIRRLGATRGRLQKGRFSVTLTPEASFAAKPSKEEIRYFGDPTKPPPEPSLASLLGHLDAGGGLALSAVAALSHFQGEKSAAGKVVPKLDPRRRSDVRVAAARALGVLANPAGAPALQKVLADDDLEVVAAAASALGSLPHETTPKALLRCVKRLNEAFAGKEKNGKWDFSDYERFLETFEAVAEGATRLGSPDTLPVIDEIVRTYLLKRHEVETSERAREDAAGPRRRLARACVAALSASKNPLGVKLLGELGAAEDLGVQTETKEAADRLSN